MTDVAKMQKEAAAKWFAELRDRICAEFERIEDELAGTHAELAPGRFERKDWQRDGGGDVYKRQRWG